MEWWHSSHGGQGRHSVVLKLIMQRFWSCSLDKNDDDGDDAVEMKTDAVALIGI